MKFTVLLLSALALFTGCSPREDAIDKAIAFRETLLTSVDCSFHTVVTADYDSEIYTFQLDCTLDSVGNMDFTVTHPESISGITGRITEDDASLTFDDQVLLFPVLADGQLTPVSAPWLFMTTLRSGYLTGCNQDDGGLTIYIDDSYEENTVSLQIQTDPQCIPIFAEIFWQGRRVLSLEIQNFKIV